MTGLSRRAQLYMAGQALPAWLVNIHAGGVALSEERLLLLSNVIELRDRHVWGHSQRVARFATLMAQELGLPLERMERVRKAGLLHDIGKLGISESILFKPGRLTPAEYEIVKQHAALGADIISRCHSLGALLPFVRHHHEHYDGGGYPDRLQGQAIPLEARILSVADAVEAMASGRPYRPALDRRAILTEIQHHAGAQFDPEVVIAFVRVAQIGGDGVIVNSRGADEAHTDAPDEKSDPLPAST